jgi:hypothetical protein
VAPIPSIRRSQDNTLVKTTGIEDSGPGFSANQRLFSLNDQLRQDLELGADDPGALEEIRQTLSPTGTAVQPGEIGILPERRTKQAQPQNPALQPRLEPRFIESTPEDSEIQAKDSRRLMERSSPGRRVGTQGFWLLAALVVAGGLFMQARYWLFDELSAIQSARAPLELFCSLAGCSVPPPLMGPAFRVLKTRVDLDPQLPGAVIVKVHLANRTATSRPYPAIQLTLTNREGETIGKRTYMAEDYATETSAGELPADGVAVVSLHLASPDEDAVGFQASIVNTGT